MPTFIEPTVGIIKKLRLDANVLARVPASNIHEAFPSNDTADIPGIYVLPGVSPMSQIVGSANRTSQILMGSAVFLLIAYSNKGVGEARRLGLVACEALLPSIVTSGLWKLDYSFEREVKNKLFDCWEAVYTINCPLREWRTKELV